MKGITPVIAVILLLLVTIAMVAFAFVWFGRISTSAMSAVENQTGQFYQTAGKMITIDNILSSPTQTIVTVRNIGTLTILSSEITIYRGTVLASCTPSWLPSSIPPGQSSTCTVTGPCTGTTIKVTSPGNFDQTNC